MLCEEKVEKLRRKEYEYHARNVLLTSVYYIRIKTSLFRNLDPNTDFPEYSYVVPDEYNGIRLIMEPPTLSMPTDVITLVEALKLYDEIATRAFEISGGYKEIYSYCKEYHIMLPTNRNAVRGGIRDYKYKLALNVIGAAIVECSKINLIFDKMTIEDFSEIMISNSFMMFDLYALDVHYTPSDAPGRVVCNLDNFITIPKHMYNSTEATYMCS